MKNIIAVTMAALFALSLGVEVRADEYGAAEAKSKKKPSVKREEIVEKTVTVKAVDLPNRIVTLQDESGESFDIKVSERAKNLPQVKPGDLVNVKYYQSIAVDVVKAGEASPETRVKAIEKRAKPGEKPGGVIGQEVTVTAQVTAIDSAKQEVTLKGPEGKAVKVKVKDPKNLENVEVGDDVIITYTEAMAISVEKAKK